MFKTVSKRRDVEKVKLNPLKKVTSFRKPKSDSNFTVSNKVLKL